MAEPLSPGTLVQHRTPLPLTVKRTIRRLLGVLLRFPPSRFALEALARFVGRRAPGSWISQAMIFHVREGLRSLGDHRIRFAKLPGGSHLAVSLDEGIWQMVYFGGRYEPESTRFVLSFLRTGDVFFDVGANVGYYTMIAAAAVGAAGKVHAFEPNPDVVTLLRVSIKRGHKTDRVRLNNAAVGSSMGSTELHLPAEEWNTGEASLLRNWVRAGRSYTVPMVTLDEYCTKQAIHSIRLLKIDVEGSELEVLLGSEDVLGRIRPHAILCEFVPGTRTAAQLRVLETFRRHHYQSFFINPDGRLSAHDGSLPRWRSGNLCFLPDELASAS